MNINYSSFTMVFLSILILGGCGSGSKGSINLLDSPISNSELSSYSDLIINVNVKKSMNLRQLDTDRITQKIKNEILADNPKRFKTINTKSSNHKKILAEVMIKRYDKGNAFARLMFIGLGQIHIDADVILFDYLNRNKLAQYEVTKTFAWGGVFGGYTDIRQVELGFSKAVAGSIIGKN